jgi:hypothetical protein
MASSALNSSVRSEIATGNNMIRVIFIHKFVDPNVGEENSETKSTKIYQDGKLEPGTEVKLIRRMGKKQIKADLQYSSKGWKFLHMSSDLNERQRKRFIKEWEKIWKPALSTEVHRMDPSRISRHHHKSALSSHNDPLDTLGIEMTVNELLENAVAKCNSSGHPEMAKKVLHSIIDQMLDQIQKNYKHPDTKRQPSPAKSPRQHHIVHHGQSHQHSMQVHRSQHDNDFDHRPVCGPHHGDNHHGQHQQRHEDQVHHSQHHHEREDHLQQGHNDHRPVRGSSVDYEDNRHGQHQHLVHHKRPQDRTDHSQHHHNHKDHLHQSQNDHRPVVRGPHHGQHQHLEEIPHDPKADRKKKKLFFQRKKVPSSSSSEDTYHRRVFKKTRVKVCHQTDVESYDSDQTVTELSVSTTKSYK